MAVDIESEMIQVENSMGNTVELLANPFKMKFYDANGALAAIVNEQGLTTLEHLKPKHQPEDPENDPGSWEESFKSFHDSKPRGPEGLSMDVTFPKASHIYGIPEHADSFALRTTKGQEPYRLYNLDVFEYELYSTTALYGSIPVAYAHGVEHTVGVFWLNSAETWVDIENTQSNVSSMVNFVSGKQSELHVSARFISESGILEAYILLGPSPSDCFRQYTKLTGTANLPPLFSLGYHQSRWNYFDEEDVRSVDAGFDKHDIPMDVIWLDIEYTEHKKYFTWDRIKFPHPEHMIGNLTAKGRHTIIIIDPHIKRQPGYFVHDFATDHSLYVKDTKFLAYEGTSDSST